MADFEKGGKAGKREDLESIIIISLDVFGQGLSNGFKFFEIDNGVIDLDEPENERIIDLEVYGVLHFIFFPNIKHVQISLLDDERGENVPVKGLVYTIDKLGSCVLSARGEDLGLYISDFTLRQLAIREI